MKLTNIKASLFHILVLRWLTLANVISLLIFERSMRSLLIFILVIIYNLLLTVFWSRVTRIIKVRQAWLLVDVTISGILIGLTGGGWMSPYTLYGLTSILIVSFFSSIKGAVLFTGYLVLLYTVGIALNKENLTNLKLIDLNLILTSYFAAFIATAYFIYPAHIIRRIEETKEEASKAQRQLSDTKELIASIAINAKTLTCREAEVLSELSMGKTNKQIAEDMHISERTVSTHLYRIYKKVGVSSREEAVFLFLGKRKENGDN